MGVFIIVQTLVEPRKKADLTKQITLEMKETFAQDRQMLRQEILQDLQVQKMTESWVVSNTEMSQEGVASPVDTNTNEEKLDWSSYINSPIFLQGMVLGSACSLVLSFLFHK